MGSRSAKQKGSRAADRLAEAVLPKPSITLDVVLPGVDGSPDQRRPVFTDFDKAIAALTKLKAEWTKLLPAHKRAARKK